MDRRVVSAVVSLGVALSSSVAIAQTTGRMGPVGRVNSSMIFPVSACVLAAREQPLTATVTADQAMFIFPTGNYKLEWKWNADGPPPVVNGTRIMRQDYNWSVQVGGKAYFGFSHHENGTLQTGSFMDLIKAGELQDFLLVSNEPFKTTPLHGLTVEQLPCGDVAILISDKENIDAIFAARPKTVSVAVPAGVKGILGMMYEYKDIIVNYKD